MGGDQKRKKQKKSSKKREPPKMFDSRPDDDELKWVSSTKIEGEDEQYKSPLREGLTVDQQTQYSILRRKGGWLEVRDEVDNGVFYVETQTMKTTWNVNNTPFEPPKKSINALTKTLRECKMDRWKILLGEQPEATSPPITSRPYPTSPLTPITPQGMISSFTKGQSFRLGIANGLSCPYTGNTYPFEDYLSLAKIRKIEVKKLLKHYGVPDEYVYITEPEVSYLERQPYNEISRTCFKTLLTSALRWARGNDGDRAAKTLDNRLQKLFLELKYEADSLHSSVNTCRGSPLRTFEGSIKKCLNSNPIITIGTKVIPHPENWNWGSQEHGHCYGTVVEVHVLTGWVEIRWSATGILGMHKWPEELQYYTEPGNRLSKNE